jgi:predicted transcriptional regulator
MASKKITEQTITVKQLAEKAGIPPASLRRILRARFPRVDKGKAYEWKPNDPQIELILKAAKNGHKPVKAEKKATKKTQPKVTKKAVKSVPMVATMSNPILHKPTGEEPGAVK